MLAIDPGAVQVNIRAVGRSFMHAAMSKKRDEERNYKFLCLDGQVDLGGPDRALRRSFFAQNKLN